MQNIFLTWLIDKAPDLGSLMFLIWIVWTGRGELAKLDARFKLIEDRLKSLEDDFQTLIAVLKKKKILKKKFGQKTKG